MNLRIDSRAGWGQLPLFSRPRGDDGEGVGLTCMDGCMDLVQISHNF